MQYRMKRFSIAQIVIVFALAISSGLVGACATDVPPTVTVQPHAPIFKSEGIYVIAVKHRDEVMDSLTQAGLTPVDRPTASGYALQVNVGNSRKTGDCGSVHNVVYIVTAAGQHVMTIKGRGPTGDCDENIFVGMSAMLASYTAE